MISVVYNEIQKGIEIFMDDKGADLLIKKLQTLKSLGENEHLHIYGTDDDGGLCMKSPYGEDQVFGELILDLLPSDAFGDRSAVTM